MESPVKFADPPRLTLAARIEVAIRENQVVVVTGDKGLGQAPTIDAAVAPLSDWRCLAVCGNWLTRGYLAGFQELLDLALHWCHLNLPENISRHEQSIKRLLPHYNSPHFKVPKDLTNTSTKEERTRFYHHEYQNKLLVGLAEFLIEYLRASTSPVLLIIDEASSLSPTATNLLNILLRIDSSANLMKAVLVDCSQHVFIPQAITESFAPYSYQEMAELLHLEESFAPDRAHRIHMSSRGNLMLARAIIVCELSGVPLSGYLDGQAMVDLYLATLGDDQRKSMMSQYVAANCASDDYIQIRNYHTYNSDVVDEEHRLIHERCMSAYTLGVGPLVVFHAHAIRNKYQRLEALAEPSEILKNIGLYDTWFSYFGELFADRDLRSAGSGDHSTNAVFVNGAFVLYSLGCGAVSAPYLDHFYHCFPKSRFIPTVLYAQSMTYARYQQPVNLPAAERYALLNLETIEAGFAEWEKYDYIKVFAENAYAYIKAKQGKYEEALTLCTKGNARMQHVYGKQRFALHQSILIYNTSQIYELVKSYDRAEAQLRLAISYDPYYGEYYNDLGNILSRLPGRAKEALDAYSTAIDLCPPYYEAHLNRGMLRAALGDDLSALRDFNRALEIKPVEWRAFLEIGNLHLSRGACEQALQAYQKASAIEWRNADLECNMGFAHSECGNQQAAISHYREAIALDRGHAGAHNNLAIALFESGEMIEALRQATIAAEIGGDPDYEENRRSLEIALKGITPDTVPQQ